MKKITLLLSLLMLGGLQAASAPTIESILSCAAVEDDDARLSCFDGVVASIQADPVKDSLKIAQFVLALKESDLEVGECSDVLYSIIMAVDGCRLKIEGKSIEVYEYDLSIKSGADALARLEQNGLMGSPVITAKNLMLVGNSKHKHWEKVVSIFEAMR